MAVSGIDGAYEPLTTYRMRVQLEDPDAQRWGFELTVLDGSNASIGTLSTIDGNTQLSTDVTGTGRTYLKHTSNGTAFGTIESHSWEFDWQSPESGTGEVTFYVAGNAANGNFSNSGDRIYTSAASFSENVGTSAPTVPSGIELLPNVPNPFNPSTTISYRLESSKHIALTIHDVRGRYIDTLFVGWRAAGTWDIVWDATDRQGRRVVSGTYLVSLESDEGLWTRSIVLLE